MDFDEVYKHKTRNVYIYVYMCTYMYTHVTKWNELCELEARQLM